MYVQGSSVPCGSCFGQTYRLKGEGRLDIYGFTIIFMYYVSYFCEGQSMVEALTLLFGMLFVFVGSSWLSFISSFFVCFPVFEYIIFVGSQKDAYMMCTKIGKQERKEIKGEPWIAS